MSDRLWRVRHIEELTVVARTALDALDVFREHQTEAHLRLEVAVVPEPDTVEDGST